MTARMDLHLGQGSLYYGVFLIYALLEKGLIKISKATLICIDILR